MDCPSKQATGVRFKHIAELNSGSDAGWSLVSSIGALIVFAVFLPTLMTLWQVGVEAVKKRVVAQHFMAVADAAALYGKQFHSTLRPLVTATTGPAIALQDLKDAQCLPARFSAQNAWGQGYSISARLDPSTDSLAMIVLTTGGRGHDAAHPDFGNIMVPETAALAKAGFIPTGLVGGSGVLRGAYGGWEIALASYGLTGSAGHLGSVSSLSAADLMQDFLYRVDVPGMPGLNSMETNLDMSDHSINNVYSLDYAPHAYSGDFCTSPEDDGRTFLDSAQGLYLCRSGKAVLINDTGNSLMMQGAELGYHNQLIDKPVCPPGTQTHPEIFVSPAILSAGAETPAMASMQAWANDYSATQWQLQLRVLTAQNEWVYPTADYGRMLVMMTCSQD